MNYRNTFVLLQNEGALMQGCFKSSLSTLRAARSGERGQFYSACFNYAIGLERLLKVLLLLDNWHRERRFPDNSALKQYGGKSGHNVEQLYEAARNLFSAYDVDWKDAYWRGHCLPVCGLVYDPASDTARWVDITAHVNEHPTQFTIEAPDTNIFDQANFNNFRDHFLSYRLRFSDAASFGRALEDFSHLEDVRQCENGIRALFSFHRNRVETWYYIISVINNFRGQPLLRLLILALSHVPGHGDILWVPGENTIPECVCKDAEVLLRRMLSRDSIVTLLAAIGNQGGFERGTIGQCVQAIIGLAPNHRASLESIIFDETVSQDVRYWALLRQILNEQHRDRAYCITITEKASPLFTDEDHQECVRGLLETLRTPGRLV